MRVLMVLESEFPPDLRVENEMLALTGSGFEVHLACSAKRNQPEKELFGKAVIHRKKMSQFIYKSSVGCLRFPFYFNFWRKHILNLLKKDKYDAIHVHDLPLSKLGVEVKKKYKIPLVIDLHENWPGLLKYAPHAQTIIGRLVSSNEQWTQYEKDMLQKADLVLTVVEEARDRIASLGIGNEKLCIVSNTLNTDTIQSHDRKRADNDFVLFYGGGLNRHRGLQIVLNAIKILKDRNIKIRLEIAGSGSYKGTLEKQALKLGISPIVTFHGQKPLNDMLELLAEADAAIIPHLRTDNNDATIPHKLFQYMYQKKTIISSDCPPLKRIINETGSGFTYQSDSPEELADLIERIFTDETLLESAGRNGNKAVIEKYNWKVDKQRLLESYNQLTRTMTNKV
jgi:glycosyltransferase involved in cell wall biosynthesis